MDLQRSREVRLVVVYEFSVGDDGPYTGESSWAPWSSEACDMNINDRLKAGERVTVRYRRDDPSINRLDSSLWRNLGGL